MTCVRKFVGIKFLNTIQNSIQQDKKSGVSVSIELLKTGSYAHTSINFFQHLDSFLSTWFLLSINLEKFTITEL